MARFAAERVLSDQQPYLDDLSSWQAWTGRPDHPESALDLILARPRR
ncbi:MAG: hypothetical protein ABW215_16320 [Kibdelosporangium sp.]